MVISESSCYGRGQLEIVRLVQEPILYLEVLLIVIELQLQLLKLFQLWNELALRHVGVEVNHLLLKAAKVLIDADEVSKPLRYLTLARLIRIPVIHEDYGTVVLDVSDHSSNRLIDCPCCLLRIPL